MANINAETPFRNSVLGYLCRVAQDHGNGLRNLKAAVDLDDTDVRVSCAFRAEKLQSKYGIDDKYRAVFEEHALRAAGVLITA